MWNTYRAMGCSREKIKNQLTKKDKKSKKKIHVIAIIVIILTIGFIAYLFRIGRVRMTVDMSGI